MNPVADVKDAAKSAFKFRYLVALIFGLLILTAIADATGVWDWLFRPVSKFKAWNAARNAAGK